MVCTTVGMMCIGYSKASGEEGPITDHAIGARARGARANKGKTERGKRDGRWGQNMQFGMRKRKQGKREKAGKSKKKKRARDDGRAPRAARWWDLGGHSGMQRVHAFEDYGMLVSWRRGKQGLIPGKNRGACLSPGPRRPRCAADRASHSAAARARRAARARNPDLRLLFARRC